uniref:Uncharacterized protein n=1 Tax=Pundamilia nyererei TaxID=303518 RepID=A0A3B4GXU2_9CICH
LAKDHGLCNGKVHIELFRNNLLCKPPHRVLKCCREKEHLTVHRQSAPVDSNALVPVALGGDHHISLIQHKHGDLFGVNELVLGAPVVDCARCTNDNLLEYKHYHILTSISPNGICQLHIWTKFPHLLNDLTSLQCDVL